jgi:hypothetical protein
MLDGLGGHAEKNEEAEVDSQVKNKPSRSSTTASASQGASQKRTKSKQIELDSDDEMMEETLVDKPATQSRRTTESQSQGQKVGMKRSDGNGQPARKR